MRVIESACVAAAPAKIASELCGVASPQSSKHHGELVVNAADRIAKDGMRAGRAHKRRNGRFARDCGAERRYKSWRTSSRGRRCTGAGATRTVSGRLRHDRGRRCRGCRWCRRRRIRSWCGSGWRRSSGRGRRRCRRRRDDRGRRRDRRGVLEQRLWRCGRR